MLDHFLHDQRIADDKTLSFWPLKTTFLAQHRTEIQLHEQHQPQLADTPIHQVFKLGIGGSAGAGLTEFQHVRSADSLFYRSNHRFERSGRNNNQPLYFDLTYHLTTP